MIAWEELLRAAKVIALTPETRKYLEQHDPMALKQLDKAIEGSDPDYPTTLANMQETRQAAIMEHLCGLLKQWYNPTVVGVTIVLNREDLSKWLVTNGLKEPYVTQVLRAYGLL